MLTNNVCQSLFEKDVQVMTQKATAMADALHRNYIRSDQLQRENEILRNEYDILRSSMETTRKEEEQVEDEEEGEEYFNNENDSQSRQNNTSNSSSNNSQTKRQTSESLLRNLDSSDKYVKRKYPPVPKTPGTMFATEFVETMTLEVGEHAYLAEIMDRQWKTSTDYRL